MSTKCQGCIACPVEVRGLYAIAHNLITLAESQDTERIRRKLPERMRELRDAVDRLKPFVDLHFGDCMNTHQAIAQEGGSK